MRDIEVGGRLIEQEQLGALTERHGEKDPLPLPTGERMHLARSEFRNMRGIHRPRDGCAVFCRIARLKELRMGETPIGNKLPHRKPLHRCTLLRQDGTHACKCAL